jgi:hypothetical protein
VNRELAVVYEHGAEHGAGERAAAADRDPDPASIELAGENSLGLMMLTCGT